MDQLKDFLFKVEEKKCDLKKGLIGIHAQVPVITPDSFICRETQAMPAYMASKLHIDCSKTYPIARPLEQRIGNIQSCSE